MFIPDFIEIIANIVNDCHHISDISPEKVKQLIISGIDIHAGDDFVFRCSAAHGQLDTVVYLVENCHADIHANEDDAFLYSAEYGHLEVVKYLVGKGVDMRIYDDFALRLSAGNGKLEMVKYLVEKGADIHADNDNALQMSAGNGHFEVTKYLLLLGSRNNIITNTQTYQEILSLKECCKLLSYKYSNKYLYDKNVIRIICSF